MGTDCTALVEVKITDNWVPALIPIWNNPLFKPDSPNPLLRDKIAIVPIIEREYALFSLLADVRNRTGRGWKTAMKREFPDGSVVEWEYDTDDGGHDPLIPIDNPRGVPEDATEPWRNLAESDAFHDLTYLSLKELLEAPWGQRVYSQGVVSEEEYLAYRDHGTHPKMIARGAGGDGLRVVNEVEYESGERGKDVTVVDLRFDGGVLRQRCDSFFRHIDMMRAIAPDDDPTRVRMMLAFDS